MSKHLIFCFSGTGNSLHIAKQIGEGLSDTLIVPMTGKPYDIPEDIESIGFVYPVYFGGLPMQVGRYLEKLNIPSRSYVYAIATYGGMLFNGFRDLHTLMKTKNQRGLDYGNGLLMFDNYVVLYSMKNNPERLQSKTVDADKKLKPIISDVKSRKKIEIKKSNWLIRKYYDSLLAKGLQKDADFVVSDNCTQCNRCQQICPVENVVMKEGKPTFQGKCEQCMACIQTCPAEAINYKNKTQSRGRYFHPAVKIGELVRFNHQSD